MLFEYIFYAFEHCYNILVFEKKRTFVDSQSQ